MYALPKVQKSVQKPPGSPIVALNDCLMEPMSQYVDRILRPLVESLPSYLKDTTDFLKQLSDINIDNHEESEIFFYLRWMWSHCIRTFHIIKG